MSPVAARFAQSPELNTTVMVRYLWCGTALALLALVYALFNLPSRYLYLAVAAPVALIIITHPRLALYQFVFALFIEYSLVPSIPLYLIDVSMGLVIAAGILDFSLRGGWPQRLPSLSLNYGYIVVALLACGLFGYWPELAGRRVLTMSSLLLLLLAVYWLSSRVPLTELMKLFFFLAVCHSAMVLIPFLVAGGEYRSFSFRGVLFDDQAMVALPVGIAFFLAASRRTAPCYIAGIITVLGGLVATQSRAPIVMALAASLFVVIVAWKRVAIGSDWQDRRRVRNRIGFMALGSFVSIGIALILQPQLLSGLIGRFEELISWEAQGSTVYRLALWKQALTAFLDHPAFGVGPGGFFHLNEIYPSWHIAPDYPYLKTLGAHNVLLHYLADTGLLGGLGLLALLTNQYRIARKGWRGSVTVLNGPALALYGWSFLFALSTFVEAAWMWGQLSFLAVFFAALIARQHRELRRIKS